MSVFKVGLPTWIEKLVIASLKNSVTPADVAETITNAKAWVVAELRKLAASTAFAFDDKLVDMVEQALTSCSDDLQFLCDLVDRGEAALVDLLRDVSAKSPTIIDDWAVEVLAKALGVPKK